jgi:Spy/CpxP family protein refolding chaperone
MQNAATLKAMFVGIVLALGAVATPAAAQRADDMKGGGGNPCVGDAQNKSRLTPACRAELGGGEKKAGKTRRASRHSRRYYRRHR